MKPAILIHGGAGPWPDRDDKESTTGVKRAAVIGWEILSAGGSALDAVEKATNYLEDHPLFDAGKGSFLNELGEVEMDALIVDGSTINFGSVSAVQHVQYPISLARLVMTETRHTFFTGEGADWLAEKAGMPVLPNLHFVTPDTYDAFIKHDEKNVESLGTVGAVAIDANGHIASATSTGGMRDRPKGRVGDTPMFGAGGYADNRFGAASATGVGEHAMRTLLSKYAVDQIMQNKSAQEAATAAMNYANDYFNPSNLGLIVVDKYGHIGAAHTTPKMPIAWIDENGNAQCSTGGGIDGLTLS